MVWDREALILEEKMVFLKPFCLASRKKHRFWKRKRNFWNLSLSILILGTVVSALTLAKAVILKGKRHFVFWKLSLSLKFWLERMRFPLFLLLCNALCFCPGVFVPFIFSLTHTLSPTAREERERSDKSCRDVGGGGVQNRNLADQREQKLEGLSIVHAARMVLYSAFIVHVLGRIFR